VEGSNITLYTILDEVMYSIYYFFIHKLYIISILKLKYGNRFYSDICIRQLNMHIYDGDFVSIKTVSKYNMICLQ
jgi:hypothetical protein